MTGGWVDVKTILVIFVTFVSTFYYIEAERADISDILNLIDIDGNGHIDRQELEKVSNFL